MKPMSSDAFYEDLPSVAVGENDPVTTIQVSKNTLLCLGLRGILAGTRFNVWQDPARQMSDVPALSHENSILFIVDGGEEPGGWLELMRELKTCHPMGRIVVMADHFELDTLMSAREAGADGILLTTIDHHILVRSLELVMLGEVVVSSALTREILIHACHDAAGQPPSRMAAKKLPDPKCHKLSSRETEILHCLTEGSPNKVIARKLNLCEATVKVHIKSILRKIGVFNRTQAAIWATDHMPHKMDSLEANVNSGSPDV
jgi:two-component system, NarL family, nitrate/nitrite response regulator NarL